LNQQYIKNDNPERIARLLSPHMGNLGIDPANGPDLVEVATAQQERAQTLVEMAEISEFFYRDFDAFDEKAARKHLRPVAREPLVTLRNRLGLMTDWQPEPLHELVKSVAEALELNLGKVAQPLRVAIAGRAASPGIDITLYLVGKDACLRRIDKALEYIRVREEGSDQ
jgi:glutamyl-tRNA synthetase